MTDAESDRPPSLADSLNERLHAGRRMRILKEPCKVVPLESDWLHVLKIKYVAQYPGGGPLVEIPDDCIEWE